MSAPATSLDPLALLGPDTGASVRVISASTLMGSATIDGRSKQLGNATDLSLLNALRDWADVVLVGARTVEKENYFGVRRTPARPEPAAMAVPSRSLRMDTTRQFFTNTFTPPLFLVPHESLQDPDVAARAQRLREAGARIIDAGPGTMADYLAVLRARGLTKIACEGGPGIVGQLVEIDAVDRLYLTLDPTMSSTVESALAYRSGVPVYREMKLENLAADSDGTVFLRYSRACCA